MSRDELLHILSEAKKVGIGADLRRANLGESDLSGLDLGESDLRGANLSWADLRGANLSWADLRGANLRGANLRGANLSWANLSGLDLGESDLRGAQLRGANLSRANLRWAKLTDVYGNNKEIKSLQNFEEYDIAYTSDRLQIGCENHAINDWWDFDDKQILEMDGKKALNFWRKNKEPIKQIIEQCPATATVYEELKQ